MTRAELTGIARGIETGFAQVRRRMQTEIDGLIATATAAREAAEAASERAQALHAQLHARDEALEVMRSAIGAHVGSIEGAALSDVVFDAGRIVVRRADGREFAVELPRPDLDAVAVLVVERHLDKLKGDKGDQGDPPVIDVVEVAGHVAHALRTDPDFIAEARGERGEQGLPGAPCEPWAPGVYRAGTRRSHFIGRVYEAVADTADEPGDSAQWRRLDTSGLRPVGAREPREPGDMHTSEGALFMFDGAKSWLMCARSVTPNDAEALLNPLRQQIRNCNQRTNILDSRTTAIGDIASAANESAARAQRWIEQRGEAIDALLQGGA